MLTAIVLITGPSEGGIGGQVAIAVASATPKLLILAGRNEAKIAPVIEEIKKIDPDAEVKFLELNLLSHGSVRKSVEKIKEITKNVDFLINNAGVMATRKFTLSADNVECQFAANYLSHFLLTNLLVKEGVLASGGVIVNVGSLGYQMADIQFDDISYGVGNKPFIRRISILTQTERRDLQRLESIRSGEIRADSGYSWFGQTSNG